MLYIRKKEYNIEYRDTLWPKVYEEDLIDDGFD
jgi:hypothetical protein